jgi:hypothetical protein
MKLSVVLLATLTTFGAACVLPQREASRGGITSTTTSRESVPFDYKPWAGRRISLNLSSMTSLPGGIAFLGGYYSAGEPVHTSLLVSRDGGKSWSEAAPKFGGLQVGQLVSYGTRMAWAMVNTTVEGTESPENLLISRDAGATWETVRWNWSPPGGPLTFVNHFRFFDEQHGQIWITNSGGRGELYETSDSGKSWRSVWRTTSLEDNPDASPAPQRSDPSRMPPGSGFWPEVLNTTLNEGKNYYTLRARILWRNPAGDVVPSDSSEWLQQCSRVQCSQTFSIERLRFEDRRGEEHDSPERWERISEIASEYVVANGSLTPTR